MRLRSAEEGKRRNSENDAGRTLSRPLTEGPGTGDIAPGCWRATFFASGHAVSTRNNPTNQPFYDIIVIGGDCAEPPWLCDGHTNDSLFESPNIISHLFHFILFITSTTHCSDRKIALVRDEPEQSGQRSLRERILGQRQVSKSRVETSTQSGDTVKPFSLSDNDIVIEYLIGLSL